MMMFSRLGFTLLEFAIVLIVIGLIVGGILVGRDLVAGAAVRAVLSESDRFVAAMNGFRLKYGHYPGDLRVSDATALGFASRSGAAGSGDGNGFIDSCGMADLNAALDYAGCENVLVWRDLAEAGLISGDFAEAGDALATSLTAEQVGDYFPSIRGEDRLQLHVFRKSYNIPPVSQAGRNQQLLGIAGLSGTAANGNLLSLMTMTPAMAFAIDAKVDNGLPQTGRILATSSAESGFNNVILPPRVCYWNGTSMNAYRLNAADRDAYICKMMLVLW